MFDSETEVIDDEENDSDGDGGAIFVQLGGRDDARPAFFEPAPGAAVAEDDDN